MKTAKLLRIMYYYLNEPGKEKSHKVNSPIAEKEFLTEWSHLEKKNQKQKQFPRFELFFSILEISQRCIYPLTSSK